MSTKLNDNPEAAVVKNPVIEAREELASVSLLLTYSTISHHREVGGLYGFCSLLQSRLSAVSNKLATLGTQPVHAAAAVAFASEEQIVSLAPDPDDEGGAAYIPLRHTAAGKFQMPLYAAAIAPAAQAETTRQVAWLIEREGYAGTAPHWYAENPEDGWHWWTAYASKAMRFASKAAAEAFPPYQMIASDPAISLTEHVFLSRAELTTSQPVPAVVREMGYVSKLGLDLMAMPGQSVRAIVQNTPDDDFNTPVFVAPAIQAVPEDKWMPEQHAAAEDYLTGGPSAIDAKHTPGPWIYYADLPSTEPNWHIVTTANKMRVLANVHIRPGNAMDEANARLIAAAPEMLAALKGVKAHMPDFPDAAWEAIDEAIAKAEAVS
ncbi:MAG: hypothetical protein EOS11_28690 [Mesorhizobium sp.]|nr:MAG: hypothetical protein EOS11_28690 [Mesorhizobium sp.]